MRSEGPERRFVYIGIGQGAGQKNTPWSRRMKIDIHTIPQALLDKAAKGKTLEAVINGTGKDGSPACATVSAEDMACGLARSRTTSQRERPGLTAERFRLRADRQL